MSLCVSLRQHVRGRARSNTSGSSARVPFNRNKEFNERLVSRPAEELRAAAPLPDGRTRPFRSPHGAHWSNFCLVEGRRIKYWSGLKTASWDICVWLMIQFRLDQYFICLSSIDKDLTNDVHEGNRKGRGFRAPPVLCLIGGLRPPKHNKSE